MKIGSISESVLKRSIIKQIKSRNKINNRMVLGGAGVGIDAGMINIPEGKVLVASTDPITTAVSNLGVLAVHTVINDIVVTGATPVAVLVTLLLSEKIPEEDIRNLMNEIRQECDKLGVKIIGGHTETTDAVNKPIVSMTGLGYVDENEIKSLKNISAGYDIVMTKGMGIEGTAVLAYDREMELLERFSPSFVRECKQLIKQVSIMDEAIIAKDMAVAMHDASEGGLYGALWEIGAASGLGLEIDLKKILVRQQTIEVTEYFDINPYTMLSGGTMLIISKDGQSVVDALAAKEIDAAVIGKMTEGHDRIVINGDERRFLEPPKAGLTL